MARRFTRSDGVVERKVRDSLILVPLKTGSARLDALYTLNETAGFIWSQLGANVSEDELAARLMAAYAVDETTARSDVHRVLDRLAAIGALEITAQEA